MNRVEKSYKVTLFKPETHDTYLLDSKATTELSTAMDKAQKVSTSIQQFNADLVSLNKYVKSSDFDKWESESIEVIDSISNQFKSLFSKTTSKMTDVAEKIKESEKETAKTVSNVQTQESEISSGIQNAGAVTAAGVTGEIATEATNLEQTSTASDSTNDQNIARQEQMDAQIKQAENEANQTVSSTNADMDKINAELESSSSSTSSKEAIKDDSVTTSSPYAAGTRQSAVYNAAKKYGVDPAMLMAISIEESGTDRNLSGLYKNSNNPGGLGGPGHWMSFSTIDDGYDYMAKLLKTNYGLSEQPTKDWVVRASQKYCGGVTQWQNDVWSIYNSLKKNNTLKY